MAIRTHISYIVPTLVNSVGSVVNKATATIAETMQSSTQMRIATDSQNDNTNGNPTLEQYIKEEANDGYVVSFISNTVIVTHHAGDARVQST